MALYRNHRHFDDKRTSSLIEQAKSGKYKILVWGTKGVMPDIMNDFLKRNNISIDFFSDNFANNENIPGDKYISLTDLARYADKEDPRYPIQNWMRNKDVISYLGLWENIHNINFKRVEFDTFKNEAGSNKFKITPQRWISYTNAIGIISKHGRYNGGTFAHPDIAFEFASWLSPEFKLYLIQEFQRLKKDEAYKEKIE